MTPEQAEQLSRAMIEWAKIGWLIVMTLALVQIALWCRK